MRLHRPIGILLLLWPALWALWIAAEGPPDPRVLFVFIAGVVLMRSAGCVINDYADRRFDPYVQRTRDRPIAAGRVSPKEALVLFVVLSLLAFGVVLLTNRLTVWLSLIGAGLAATYPFMKRVTYLPQLYLGLAFGWAVPMGFVAQTGSIPPVAWSIFLATVIWAVAYDTLYAMVDREDDLRIGVKSTAILFGRYDRLAIAAAHVVMLGLLLISGLVEELGIAYYVGIMAAARLAVYQQSLVRNREPEACFKAFLNNNWLGAAIFAGIFADRLI
jgi:4-hydroxybenzoate polyprenyltransferase